MAISDAGIHPDLVDDAPTVEPEVQSPDTAQPEGEAPTVETTAEAPETTEVTADEWFTQVKEAATPKDALRLLAKNMAADDLFKEDVLAGKLGDTAQRVAKKLIADQDRTNRENQRLEAARRGDFYTLGEQVAPEYQERVAQEDERQHPLYQGVSAFQSELEPEVQSEIAGKDYDSFTAYLKATVDSTVKHRLSQEVEREVTKRLPALKKRWLAEANGDEATPELGRGTPIGVREITDEMVAAMSLEEYDQNFDAFGRPKAGIKLRHTRALDPRRMRH